MDIHLHEKEESPNHSISSNKTGGVRFADEDSDRGSQSSGRSKQL